MKVNNCLFYALREHRFLKMNGIHNQLKVFIAFCRDCFVVHFYIYVPESNMSVFYQHLLWNKPAKTFFESFLRFIRSLFPYRGYVRYVHHDWYSRCNFDDVIHCKTIVLRSC